MKLYLSHRLPVGMRFPWYAFPPLAKVEGMRAQYEANLAGVEKRFISSISSAARADKIFPNPGRVIIMSMRGLSFSSLSIQTSVFLMCS